ncbi:MULTISPECIES: transaldolase [unclassified Serratia (in: enterobacteria)]|uniref:transaldolase n=1 Tax=unclassified Serratia (in: enterobacteria) TaxID=2647522 RepID=UPI00046AAB7B|nr:MULTISPECIES: transaldolase [unclassified Serratia (in: enterobacteria)]
MNQLESLKRYTVVVADTGDIDAIKQFSPQDATTNPSLILKAAQLPQYQGIIRDAVGMAKRQGGSLETQLVNASDLVAVSIGAEVLRHVPGRISTEVDARLSWDRGLCIAKARRLVALYQEQGIERSRLLIKLAATWEGIKAAEELEQEGINCNLTLLFSFAQARACAEAGVYLISPFVGRIYDWYQARQPEVFQQSDEDPGVTSVRNIYQYYKEHGYETVVMGASFRKKSQVTELAGCDRLTISPAILNELQDSNEPLTRKLDVQAVIHSRPSPLSQAEFLWQHHSDPMAVEKLAEGIRLFAADQEKLESMLREML